MRKVFIPGGSGGLGSALAPYFINKGWFVIYTGHDQPLAVDAANSRFIHWDMSDASTTALLTTLEKDVTDLDAWIHIIGGYWGGKSLAESPIDKVRLQMMLNFESTFTLAPTVIRLLQKATAGRAIFMGGMAGLYVQPGNGAYGVSKAALTHYFRTLSTELKSTKIRTAMLVPSTIDTPANRLAMPAANFDEWVSPQRICEICEFLCTPTAANIHNSILELI